ncbi:hypothetical protein [Flavihumibacter sp.]|uniref:hypothetical protein n=1 Tax=Flavihumibacter sp. TaxID=1913981 RepID=UPI002FCC475A|nr:hypothetical protein [Flavihumibacter sediminis]
MKSVIRTLTLSTTLMFAVFGLNACSDKGDEENPYLFPVDVQPSQFTFSNANLKSGVWKITKHLVDPAYDYNNDGKLENNAIPFYQQCDKDDYVIFTTDTEGIQHEGTNVCAGEPQQKPFTWSWEESTKKLYISTGTFLTIYNLTATEFVVKRLFSQGGKNYSEYIYYTH